MSLRESFMRPAAKPVVFYRADRPFRAQVGLSGFCYPLAHPSEQVTGDGTVPVITSPVVWVGEKGEFATANTHYKPQYLVHTNPENCDE